eukprot:2202052-Pyramimonas_sp.AAC.1
MGHTSGHCLAVGTVPSTLLDPLPRRFPAAQAECKTIGSTDWSMHRRALHCGDRWRRAVPDRGWRRSSWRSLAGR